MKQIEECHWYLWATYERESTGARGYPSLANFYTAPRNQDYANDAETPEKPLEAADWELADKIASGFSWLCGRDRDASAAIRIFYGAWPGAPKEKSERLEIALQKWKKQDYYRKVEAAKHKITGYAEALYGNTGCMN